RRVGIVVAHERVVVERIVEGRIVVVVRRAEREAHAEAPTPAPPVAEAEVEERVIGVGPGRREVVRRVELVPVPAAREVVMVIADVVGPVVVVVPAVVVALVHLLVVVVARDGDFVLLGVIAVILVVAVLCIDVLGVGLLGLVAEADARGGRGGLSNGRRWARGLLRVVCRQAVARSLPGAVVPIRAQLGVAAGGEEGEGGQEPEGRREARRVESVRAHRREGWRSAGSVPPTAGGGPRGALEAGAGAVYI